ncbi:kinase-like domain-containing protein [Lasiosphaeria miniovina]|uniref:Phosphatidylinositol 3-kinase VPS34 n=1 Tax=Lasiosphaeria miniovina TaxID=1954250 RepID=A0AA40DHP3_9PEZI|nr:kinase-like domain-containing protein [Lasiosphaeria miniovina]KAK0703535.1 kinase-like domain-containing protein [Lasiosphaeria miniovina]
MVAPIMEPFSFATSNALNFPVNIRIINLEGEETPLLFSTRVDHPEVQHTGSIQSPHSDIYVTVQVWAGSKPLTVPVQTAYKSFRNERRWNEWLSLPIYYSTLPRNAQLAITIWDVSPTGEEGAQGHAVPFGGTTLPIFDKENQVHKGRLKCRVYRHQPADGNDNSTTPAIPNMKKTFSRKSAAEVEDKGSDELELDRMEKLFKKHEMGEIPRIDWLDQLVFRGFEKRGSQAARSSLKATQRQQADSSNPSKLPKDGQETPNGPSSPPLTRSSHQLNVELPKFDFPLVYSDHEYPAPPVSSLQHLSSSQSNIILKPPPEVHYGPGINGLDTDDDGGGQLIRVYDPEVGARDNPAESKHRRLVRSQHRNGILDKDLKPNAKVRDELNLIMSYSPTHTLTPEEKDLIWKFRYHLTKNKKALTKFVKSVNWSDLAESKQAVQVLGRWTDIDVEDALELLGPTFDNSSVRAFAVERLGKSDDHELLLYLLQLVQALKYEHISPQPGHDVSKDSSLARFLISRAVNSLMLGNYFWWYVMVELDDKSPDQGPENMAIYGKVAYDFMVELVKLPGGVEARRTFLRQAEWITMLSEISGKIKESNESMPKRTERVKQFLGDPKNGLVAIEPPLPLPLDPSVEITGVCPEETIVFKSSLHPIKVVFKTTSGRKYPILFKRGDDLRQDQLVIQIIMLMDNLLQKENLDLKLSPYKILATSTSAGLSQFVPSMSFQGIASKFRSNPALAYLKQNNPDSQGPMGLRKETLDTFVKSCAGYCVITYILGVGDRHLDNLLLAPDGHFFHADFGYILGRDPKPFAPAMKLSKEMVDCMGGSNSEHYRQFKQYCFLAYSALRKNSNLILNLFSLMVDANIPDIKLEPDKAVFKVRERFHLELSEEDAIRHLERIMDDNLNALVPVVIDKLHELVQAFRT